MQYRTLGRTGLQVSMVGFGTGGPSRLGQLIGLTQQQQSKLVRRALDLGINLFDTSSRYGNSEEILGRALSGVPRSSYILSTKWVHASSWSPPGVGGQDGEVKQDPQALVRGVEQSLQRLGTDTIDIMHFHGLRTQQYATVVQRFAPVMKQLQEQGKIRFVSMTTRYIADPRHEAAALALRNDPNLWDAIMIKYGILNQAAAKEVLPLALKNNIGVMNMAAVGIKLPNQDVLEELIGEWKQRSLLPADSLPDRNPLGWLVRGDVTSVVAAGYRFAADHPAIGTVLTGTASVAHLEQNVAALENPTLPESDKQKLIELFCEIMEYA